jgi:outer membrane protein TolC
MKVLFLLLAGWLHAQNMSLTDRVFTLEDSERLARLNDPRLLSAEQDTIIAQQRVLEARFLFLPEFGLQASATKFDARYPFSISGDFRNILLFPGSQTENLYSGRGYMHLSLYEGKRHLNTLRLAQAAAKQAQNNYESVKRDVQLSSRGAFFRLILAQEKLQIWKDNENAVADIVAKAGLGVWERVDAEALLGNVRAKASEARHELDESRLAYLKSLNLELDTTFRVSGELKSETLSLDPEKASLWALELRPELQSETYKAQMDAISVNLALGRRNPSLFLAGDYELTGQRFPLRNNNWDMTVGIKIPFSYDYWTELKRKKAEQRQGELKRAEVQDRVRMEVRQAYENLQYWQREFPRREQLYKRVKELFDAAAAQAPGQSLSRARAMVELGEIYLRYLTAVKEQILARAELEWAVGRELK